MRITPLRNTKQSKTMMGNFFYFRQSIDVRFMDTNLSVGQARCSSGGTQTSYCSVHIARNYMDLKCDMVKWHRITSHIRVVCWGEKIGRIRTQRLLSTVVFLAPWHSHDDDLLNDRDQAAKSERWSPLTVVTVEDNRWPWHLDLCAYDLTSP